jgi:hypothetical protein
MTHFTLSTKSLNSIQPLELSTPKKRLLKTQKLFSLSRLKSVLNVQRCNKKRKVDIVNFSDCDTVTIKINTNLDYNTDILIHDYKLYKITQNIRNGIQLNDYEINYINELPHDKLLYIILLQNHCTSIIIQNSKLYQRETNV